MSRIPQPVSACYSGIFSSQRLCTLCNVHTVVSKAHFSIECPLCVLGSQNHLLRYNVIKYVDRMFNDKTLLMSK